MAIKHSEVIDTAEHALAQQAIERLRRRNQMVRRQPPAA
jgi:hypothetical protein